MRAPVRLLVVIGVAVLIVIQVQGLMQTLRSQKRFRERVVATIERSLASARPEITGHLRHGAGWDQALEAALRATQAAESELFTLDGRLLTARPVASPVSHWPRGGEMEALVPGAALTVGPVAGRSARLLTYARFSVGEQELVLRTGAAAPELIADLRERREILVGHGVALVLLLAVGALAALPARRSGPSAASTGALEAYVEAVERLRDHGLALSQQHEAERQRLRGQVEDKDAMARAGELTAGIVHEMRNGLGTIVGYARLIQGPDADAAAAAQRIRDECEALDRMIGRFMEFVRREELVLSPVTLGGLLSRVVSRESRNHPGPRVSLRADPDQTVQADEGLLERAFENLTRNALEAAGAGGHVWLDVSSQGETVSVTVADDGLGLPATELRPFFTTKAGGLGLGLPIAVKIVRLHGGELSFKSREPRGVSVCVTLRRGGPVSDTVLQEVTAGPSSGNIKR